jgi:hypothetical protein
LGLSYLIEFFIDEKWQEWQPETSATGRHSLTRKTTAGEIFPKVRLPFFLLFILKLL